MNTTKPTNAITLQIERIQRCVSIPFCVRSHSARLAIEEAISWLDDAKRSVACGEYEQTKLQFAQAKIALGDALADCKQTQAMDDVGRNAIYNINEGIKAIDGVIVLYFS